MASLSKLSLGKHRPVFFEGKPIHLLLFEEEDWESVVMLLFFLMSAGFTHLFFPGAIDLT